MGILAHVQDVRLKNRGAHPDLPEAARQPSTRSGVCFFLHHRDGQIMDIWFLRELTADEHHRKVMRCYPPCREPEAGNPSRSGSAHETQVGCLYAKVEP